MGEGKVVREGQPHRAAAPRNAPSGPKFVSGGHQAARGQNSCPEDNEARRKGFRERDWGG